MKISSVNPANGETLKTYNEMTPSEAASAVEQAHETWTSWRKTSFAERGRLMTRAGVILRERKHELAKLMALEMGKPVKQGIAEAEKCAWVCDYYAANAEAHLAPDFIKTEGSQSYVAFEPLGVVLAVMPWNFPLWQGFRFAAPALVAGHAGLLKHASSVPQCALAIESVFKDPGAPPGVFQTLLIDASRVRNLLADGRVAAATLTGSEGAGRSLAEHAGRHIKQGVLEPGGRDPFLVLPSAGLEEAVQVGVSARVQNAGQSCIAAKRFLLHEKIADRFEELFVSRMSALRVGDPSREDTEMGPLSSEQLLQDVD